MAKDKAIIQKSEVESKEEGYSGTQSDVVVLIFFLGQHSKKLNERQRRTKTSDAEIQKRITEQNMVISTWI